MQKTIITTVGTSLITNFLENNSGNHRVSKAFDRLKNKPFYENKQGDLTDIFDDVKKIYNVVSNESNCAEISSIVAIEKELQKTDKDLNITIHLLCTDTILSPLCAEVIAKYFEKNNEFIDGGKTITRTVIFEPVVENETIISKINDKTFISIYIIQNLNLLGYSEKGLLNLIQQIKDIPVKKSDDEIYLNISGGYKALIPPLTILAQLYRLQIFYLYEESDSIIHLPPMPVGFDWELIEKYIILLFNENQRKNQKNALAINEMRQLNLVNKTSFDLTALGIILSEYLKDKESPFTGTIMGYFVEHKLYKYFIEKFDSIKIKHSVKVKNKDGGDIDLVIANGTEIIPIEIKPVSVLNNPFNSWTQLLEKFPARIEAFKENKTIKEVWLILYGDDDLQIDVNIINQLKEKFTYAFKCKFLKVQKSKQSQERHIYQDFFKSDIDDSQITDIQL